MPAKLYRLLCELATRGLGLAPDTGGVLVSLSFRPGRWLLDLDLLEERVVGGDDLSSHEARVEDDLFRRRSLVSPSVLELPDDPSTSCGSLLAKEAFERRRIEWNKEGISSGQVEHNGSRSSVVARHSEKRFRSSIVKNALATAMRLKC